MKKYKCITHLFSALAVGFFVFMAFGSDSDDTSEASSANTTSTKTTVEKQQTPEELKQQLKREIESFNKPFNSSPYTGTVESVQMELVLFGAWAIVIKEGENSNDLENQKLASDLEKKVVSVQIKEFPKMRKRYGEAVSKSLWENDIYVNIRGKKSDIINFTGGLFAANKNIKETQQMLTDVLSQFRFKETRYRWYKGADEYTSFKMDTQSDNELVIIK